MTRGSWRVASLAVVLVAVGALVGRSDLVQASTIRPALAATGVLAPLAAALGYGLLTLFPVPRNVLSVVAGVLFGLGPGVVVVWVGSMLGAVVGYAVGRRLDADALARVTRGRAAMARAAIGRHGLAAVVWARVLPVVPFTAVNYTAGLVGVHRRDFAVGTALGVIPGTVAYVAVGAYGLTVAAVPTGPATAVVAVGALAAGVWLVRALRRRPGRSYDADGVADVLPDTVVVPPAGPSTAAEP